MKSRNFSAECRTRRGGLCCGKSNKLVAPAAAQAAKIVFVVVKINHQFLSPSAFLPDGCLGVWNYCAKLCGNSRTILSKHPNRTLWNNIFIIRLQGCHTASSNLVQQITNPPPPPVQLRPRGPHAGPVPKGRELFQWHDGGGSHSRGGDAHI